MNRGELIRAALALTLTPAGRGDRRLRSLRAAVRGPVLTRPGAAYGQARLLYQERFDDVFPLAVFQPLSAADVGAALRWAARTHVPVAVRSGGHSYGGYSTGRGLVIDLRRLRSLRLDRASGLLSADAGARMLDIEATLASAGRAIPTGSCPSVGLGGLALGGGVGFASRKLGTTSDNVVGLGIVTADGRFRRCSERENRDLFWACRGGGGGNFGVVTHFELRTHPVPDVSTFLIGWPWSQASEVIRAWQAFAPHAPDGLFSICSLGAGGNGPYVQCFGQLLGPESALAPLLRPLMQVAGGSLTTRTESYLDAQLRWAGCRGKTVAECDVPSRGSFLAKSDYCTEPLSPAGRSVVVEWIERGGGSLLLDSYGGAINRVRPGATAFVHRHALCSLQYIAHWSPGEDAGRQWLRGFYAAMRPHVSGFAYQNYIDPDLHSWRHAYYGANYPRLVEIKRKVDPDRLFSFPQAIGS